MYELNLIQKIAIYALPLLFAITLHEVAHGWIASKLGDPTAKMLGRLSINPIRHIDILGTVILPLILLATSGFIFGWAKPVPVTWQNLRHPKRDMAFVAAAGPLANLVMAFFWGAIFWLGRALTPMLDEAAIPIVLMGGVGVAVNILLMVLNLLPIPPLDGSRIVSSLLSDKSAAVYNRLEPYGLIILIILLFSGILFNLIGPVIQFLQQLVLQIFL
jgi:Zn-dependent protease